jgi:hypothetical protein
MMPAAKREEVFVDVALGQVDVRVRDGSVATTIHEPGSGLQP